MASSVKSYFTKTVPPTPKLKDGGVIIGYLGSCAVVAEDIASAFRTIMGQEHADDNEIVSTINNHFPELLQVKNSKSFQDLPPQNKFCLGLSILRIMSSFMSAPRDVGQACNLRNLSLTMSSQFLELKIANIPLQIANDSTPTLIKIVSSFLGDQPRSDSPLAKIFSSAQSFNSDIMPSRSAASTPDPDLQAMSPQIVYLAQLANDILHFIAYDDGSIYIGQTSTNQTTGQVKPNGLGSLINPDGIITKGTFRDGEIDLTTSMKEIPSSKPVTFLDILVAPTTTPKPSATTVHNSPQKHFVVPHTTPCEKTTKWVDIEENDREA